MNPTVKERLLQEANRVVHNGPLTGAKQWGVHTEYTTADFAAAMLEVIEAQEAEIRRLKQEARPK